MNEGRKQRLKDGFQEARRGLNGLLRELGSEVGERFDRTWDAAAGRLEELRGDERVEAVEGMTREALTTLFRGALRVVGTDADRTAVDKLEQGTKRERDDADRVRYQLRVLEAGAKNGLSALATELADDPKTDEQIEAKKRSLQSQLGALTGEYRNRTVAKVTNTLKGAERRQALNNLAAWYTTIVQRRYPDQPAFTADSLCRDAGVTPPVEESEQEPVGT